MKFNYLEAIIQLKDMFGKSDQESDSLFLLQNVLQQKLMK